MVSAHSPEDLCASDTVDPAQFVDLWNGTRESSSERKLAIAVLEQAIVDLKKFRDSHDSTKRRLYRRAYQWIASDDRHWLYSYVSVCELLNLPYCQMRKQLLGVRTMPLPRPKPRRQRFAAERRRITGDEVRSNSLARAIA